MRCKFRPGAVIGTTRSCATVCLNKLAATSVGEIHISHRADTLKGFAGSSDDDEQLYDMRSDSARSDRGDDGGDDSSCDDRCDDCNSL